MKKTASFKKYLKNLFLGDKLLFAFFVLSLVVYSLWLCAFSPAIMSTDSLSQWEEARNFSFGNWHPYLSTVYLAFFSAIFHTPTAVAIFQIVFTAVFFFYVFNFFLKKGVGRKVIFPLYFLLIFSIPVGLYNITIWKDVIFSLAIVVTAFLLGKKVFEQTAWRKGELLVLLIFSLVATLFRHNGVVYVFLFPILLYIYFRGKKWLFKFIATFLLIFGIFYFIIPKFIDFKDKPFWMTGQGVFALHMSEALYVHPEEEMTTHLRETLETISLDTDNLKKSYNILYWNPLFWNDKIDKEVLNSHAFWDELLPEFYLHNFLPNFFFISKQKFIAFYMITNGDGYEHGLMSVKEGGGIIYVKNNNIDVENDPMIEELNHKLGGYIVGIKQNGVTEQVIWNAFVPIILLILLLISGFIVKRRDRQVFSLFILLQLPFLIYLNIAGDWRYFYFFYLSFFVTIPFFFLKKKKKTGLKKI